VKRDNKEEAMDVSCGYSEPSLSAIFEHLPFAECKVHATFTGAGSLPPFWGPTLRGGLGYHLKKTVCHIKASRCTACIVQKSCAYSYIFEGIPPENREFMRLYPNIPQPFVLITDLRSTCDIVPGHEFEFGIRLFGKAVELFPYILYSFLEIGKEGLGKDRIPFRINWVSQPAFSSFLYKNGENHLGSLKAETISDHPVALNGNLEIEFITPVKLRVDGKIADTITFSELVKSALRRISILNYFYGSPLNSSMNPSHVLESSEKVRIASAALEMYEFTRYSNRQKKRVPLKGLIGQMVFEGDWIKYASILRWAQVCHIGKATSFGFGRIRSPQL